MSEESMSEESQPALTPAQWAARSVEADSGERWVAELPTVSADGEGLHVRLDDDYYNFTLTGQKRHGVAALALYGEPFGFSWADYEAVGNARNALGWRVMNDDDPEMARLASLMNRIAALLPPYEESR